jgi:hypothetical protein
LSSEAPANNASNTVPYVAKIELLRRGTDNVASNGSGNELNNQADDSPEHFVSSYCHEQ